MNTPPFLYIVDGIVLRSNLHLPELLAAQHQSTTYDYDFFLDKSISSQYETKWRDSSSQVLRFDSIAEFIVSVDNTCISCRPFHHADMNSIRHLLLDYVLPCVLNLHGKIVLHASAIATDKGAVAFIAPSGFGKSSLVSAFCQQGIALLADDRVVVEQRTDGFWLVPSYPQMRLWSSMFDVLWQHTTHISTAHDNSHKQHIFLHTTGLPFHNTPSPLKKVYVLAPPSDCFSIETITPKDAHIQLVQQSFRLSSVSKENLIRSFAFFNQMVQTIPFSRVCYPRKVELLPQVSVALLEDAGL